MNAEAKKPSMRDRLLAAPTLDDLVALRQESKKYNNANTNTRTKWKRAFDLRKSQLESAMTAEELEADKARRLAAKARRETKD